MPIKKLIATLLADKIKLAIALSAFTAVVAGGVTYGSWSLSKNGNAYTKAITPANFQINDASALTVAQLYPGASGDVKVTVDNTNPFPVTITSIVGAGTITSNAGAGCDASTGVTYTDETGLSLALAANTTQTYTLTNAAHMSNGTVDACKGAVFTIPVTVSATS